MRETIGDGDHQHKLLFGSLQMVNHTAREEFSGATLEMSE
jgi:hypothetical protein